MTTRTPSAKVNRLIEQAEAAGLEVEITDYSREVIESYGIEIRCPRWEADHMLAVVQNAQSVHIHALRYVGNGKAKAFALHARQYGWTRNDEIRPTHLHYAVGNLADNMKDR